MLVERIRVLAGAVEEFSSGSALCADSYFGIRSTVSAVRRKISCAVS